MTKLILGIGFILLIAGGVRAEANPGYGTVTCVPQCVQRSIQGTCWNFGQDYCGYGPGVDCVPRCVQRTIHGTCTNWGSDYCGDFYPECTLHCVKRFIGSGRCLQYGPDACAG